MNLLLDTNVLLWWLEESPRLSRKAAEAIRQSEMTYVSAVTAWEIGIKVSAGKLEFRGDLEEHLTLNQFKPLPVTVAHALAAGRLPNHHRDPFDRMLIAQARIESLTLATSDSALSAYGVPILRV